MRSSEQSSQRLRQEAIQLAETSAGEAVDIGNELDLVFHA
jgi:hypothetical protein